MALKSTLKADFSIDVEDKPGALAAVARKMRVSGIDLLGLWGYGGQKGAGKLYCVPKDDQRFMAFAQTEGLEVEEGVTVYIEGVDSAGVLVESLDRIAQADINVHAIQAVTVHGEFGCFIWADAEDCKKINELLGAGVGAK